MCIYYFKCYVLFKIYAFGLEAIFFSISNHSRKIQLNISWLIFLIFCGKSKYQMI